MKHFVVVDTSGNISVCKGNTIAEAIGIDCYQEADQSVSLGLAMWCGSMQKVTLTFAVLRDGTHVPAKVYPNLQSVQSFIGAQFESKEAMVEFIRSAI